VYLDSGGHPELVGERQPAALYSHLATFIALTDHENKILRWEGIQVIGKLAAVDAG